MKKWVAINTGPYSILKQLTKSIGFEEKRKFSRLPVSMDIRFQDGKNNTYYSGTLKDLSAGGCLLISDKKIGVGSKIKLEMNFGKKIKGLTKIKGTVVRFNNDANYLSEVGVIFEGFSRNQIKGMSNYCFKKMRETIEIKDWNKIKTRNRFFSRKTKFDKFKDTLNNSWEV